MDYPFSYAYYKINSGEFTKKRYDAIMEEAAQKRFAKGRLIPVLFCDEIHTVNKRNQSVLLTYVEEQKVVLLAATNEELYRKIAEGLLSRCKQLRFKPLTVEETVALLVKALNRLAPVDLSNENAAPKQ